MNREEAIELIDNLIADKLKIAYLEELSYEKARELIIYVKENLK